MADDNGRENEAFIEEELQVKAYDFRLLKRLLGFAARYWYLFALAVVFLFASTAADLARPYLVGVAIDDFIKKGDIASLGRTGVFFLLLVISGFVFNLLQIYVLSYAGQSIILNIRQKLFEHMQRLPLSYFDKNPVGRLVTRVTNDTEALNEVYTNVLVTLLKDFAILGGVVVIMFRLDVKMTLVSLAIMPAVIVLTVFFRRRIRKVYRNVRTSLAKINAAISENISGMRIIQLFNREKENFERFDRTGREYYKAAMSEIITFGLFRPAVEMMSFIALSLLVWFGGLEVLEGTLQFGTLYAFTNYISMLFHPINDWPRNTTSCRLRWRLPKGSSSYWTRRLKMIPASSASRTALRAKSSSGTYGSHTTKATGSCVMSASLCPQAKPLPS